MTGRSIKRSPDVIDNVQLNTFSSADIEYRHFFVFLFSICGIQLTYFSCLERNVVTNTFLLSKKLYKSYKLLFCFFPTHLTLMAHLSAFFKMANRFPFFGSSFAWICARFSPSLELNIWLPCSYLKEEN